MPNPVVVDHFDRLVTESRQGGNVAPPNVTVGRFQPKQPSDALRAEV